MEFGLNKCAKGGSLTETVQLDPECASASKDWNKKAHHTSTSV